MVLTFIPQMSESEHAAGADGGSGEHEPTEIGQRLGRLGSGLAHGAGALLVRPNRRSVEGGAGAAFRPYGGNHSGPPRDRPLADSRLDHLPVGRGAPSGQRCDLPLQAVPRFPVMFLCLLTFLCALGSAPLLRPWVRAPWASRGHLSQTPGIHGQGSTPSFRVRLPGCGLSPVGTRPGSGPTRGPWHFPGFVTTSILTTGHWPRGPGRSASGRGRTRAVAAPGARGRRRSR